MIAVTRLIYSGHIARYRVQKSSCRWGRLGLPFVVGRLKRNYEVTTGLADPNGGLARLYYDTWCTIRACSNSSSGCSAPTA